MGLCISTENGEVKKSHMEAELQLKKAKRQMDKEAKILLLGPGDSGKTTIMKQMRLITNAHFTQGELESYRQLVFANLVTGMKALIECLPEVGLSIEDDAEALQSYQVGKIIIGPDKSWTGFIEIAPDVKDGQPFPEEYLPHFKFLWQRPVIRDGLANCRQFAIPDNVTYFYSALDRLFQPDYRPTNQDVIQTRTRTVGIIETLFTISDAFASGKLPDPNACPTVKGTKRPKAVETQIQSMTSDETSVAEEEEKNGIKNLFKIESSGTKNLRIVDVGGQKSERRKWIHCFQDVTGILFLVALSGYDQCLVEERSANQMSDAMSVWESICTMEWFQDTSLILFLNKEDLFNDKIRYSSIRRYFPDYDGESRDPDAGKEYFKRRFLRIAYKGSSQWRQQQRLVNEAGTVSKHDQRGSNSRPRAKRQVYAHFTTAVNTSLVHTVMSFVADTVLRAHLTSANLL